MNDLTFLDEVLANDYGASDATLKAVLPGGEVVHISDNICPFRFLDTCPLLYHTFEPNLQSRLQASIEASSETAVISLARYCYTGSYLVGEPDGDSILLLQHAETYKIAEDFDVPELQIMAHGNFSCQIEYACCLPKAPNDILDTIRFIYRHFASDEARRKHNLVETLLNYCVAVYLYHKLGESLDFLTAVHEIPAFHQDLCRTNIARNFEDDCAAEIIRLPSGSIVESSRLSPTTLSSRDLPREMFYDRPRNTAPVDPALAKSSRGLLSLSFDRNTLDTLSFRRDIPDRSKHCISPSALTAALEKYRGDIPPDAETEDTTEEIMRRYKRARIDEVKARLPAFIFPAAGPSNELRENEDKLTNIKSKPITAANEDSYWEGAFGQSEMQSSKIVTEGTSQSARRLLFEYGRRNVSKVPSSSPTVNASMATALPHRARNPAPISDASMAADTASEDEGFAMVRRPQTISSMSSPELVPATSIAQTMTDDETASNDDWTML